MIWEASGAELSHIYTYTYMIYVPYDFNKTNRTNGFFYEHRKKKGDQRERRGGFVCIHRTEKWRVGGRHLL